jgi:hypothetical protein
VALNSCLCGIFNKEEENFREVIRQSVNCAGAVSDQKTSKFVVPHWEESMAGHMGVKVVY